MINHNLNLDDFILDEIESIEFIGEEETIDITVEDTNMFYANDIYTHNSSIKADVVEADQMGGSIKKAQIAHFVVSIAKTLDQKEKSTATMAVLKSRFGQSGMIFEDVIFDNARIQIEMGENKEASSRSEYKKNVEIKDQKRVNSIIGAIQTKNMLLNSDLFETTETPKINN